MKFDLFGSKAERAEKKLEEKKKKHEQYIKDTDRLRYVEVGTEIIDNSKSRKEKEEFNRKVAKIRASLKLDEEKMLTKMVGLSYDIKTLEEKNRKTKKERVRFKNCYYTVLIIRRALERLSDIEDDRQMSMVMGDINKQLKTMNQISVGYQPLQKLLFRYRKTRLDFQETYEENRIKSYYGKELDETISDADVRNVLDTELIDLLVKDDIYDVLLDNCNAENIRQCVDSNVGIDLEPDDVERMRQKNAESKEPIPGIDNSDVDEEEYEKYRQMYSKM